jgi:dihydrofolate reductase
MDKKNRVFIAQSLDGYIAGRNGELDWLQAIPNPTQDDMDYTKFMEGVDAIVMGRKTFDTVCSFDVDWPYHKPVFVLSHTLKSIPEEYKEKAELIKGSISSILKQLHQKEYYRLYIDGGATVQSFLKEDRVDELIVTTLPVLLGGGVPLFSQLPEKLEFDLVESKVFLDQVVQSHYKRKKKDCCWQNVPTRKRQ